MEARVHDKDGKELKVGDRVTLECTVKEIQAGTEYCNVTLTTVEPMFPSDRHDTIVANTKQVRKVE